MAFKLKTPVIINLLLGYNLGVVTLGFLTHPYKTVQNVVKRQLPAACILIPSFAWLVGFILLRTLEHVLFSLIPFIGFWWFLFVWVLLFTLMWQILLLYLFVRFILALSSR